MKVRLARTAGFCMGVRRAMELALAAAHADDEPLFTYGPLIHNPQVLDLLAAKGIKRLDHIPEPGSQKGGTVIIRAHGVPPEAKTGLRAAGFTTVLEGTCPRVIRVQAIIHKAAKHGRRVVIVGDSEHPEVVGLLGHARGLGWVVATSQAVAELPELEQVVVVAQTTQNEAVFAQVVEALKQRFGQVEVHDTICAATHRRQDEVKRLAREVDGVVVVGGKESGNTRRLAQVAALIGKPVVTVESETEIDPESLRHLGSVGVTAGASTPNWMIKRVVREVSAIRSDGEVAVNYMARRAFRFMVRSQLVVAIGAAGMSVAGSLLQSIKPTLTLAGIAFFYIYAMHLLNHFLDKEAGQYNDPDRAAFLNKHSRFLVGSGAAAGAAGLVLCWTLGLVPFAMISVMSVLGLLYSVPFFPRRLEDKIGIHRLKDIPGSKTLAAAVAWAMVAAVLPAVATGTFEHVGLLVAVGYVLGLVFLRCALFDILDVQGDLIVGKETLPIFLGAAKTHRLLRILTVGLAVVLALSPLLGWTPSVAWVLLLPLGGMLLMQSMLGGTWMMPGTLSEGLVEFNFWLAGAAALVWAALNNIL